mmetsp:Transcript_21489/g.54778  ORF Transcript_21489/g.54778 Transcript_21489/m.54778 type:complete len:253 (-) Transcript_21489:56-814(-)
MRLRQSSSQHRAWKAKRLAPGLSSVASETGGSCRKSPQKTIWSPPKGFFGHSRTLQRPSETPCRNSPESIETSSMTMVLAGRSRPAARTMPAKSSGFLPKPQPRKECSVPPPTWQAAAPVEAHTANSLSRNFLRSASMTAQSVKDLPVPGNPVKKTLSPASTASTTRRCSSDSCEAWDSHSGTGCLWGLPEAGAAAGGWLGDDGSDGGPAAPSGGAWGAGACSTCARFAGGSFHSKEAPLARAPLPAAGPTL